VILNLQGIEAELKEVKTKNEKRLTIGVNLFLFDLCSLFAYVSVSV